MEIVGRGVTAETFADIERPFGHGVRMVIVPDWLTLWLVTCSSQQPGLSVDSPQLQGTIGFRTTEAEYKVDLSLGALLQGDERVACWLEGQEETFTAIANGTLNLQQAMVQGVISAKGDPMQLLAVSKLVHAGLRVRMLRSN